LRERIWNYYGLSVPNKATQSMKFIRKNWPCLHGIFGRCNRCEFVCRWEM